MRHNLDYKEFEIQLALGILSNDAIYHYIDQEEDEMYLRLFVQYLHSLNIPWSHSYVLYNVMRNPICPNDLMIYIGLLTWKYDFPYTWKMYEKVHYYVDPPCVNTPFKDLRWI